MKLIHRFKELPSEKCPQDPNLDGTGLRFETMEHGGEYPDTMPQAVKLTDAEGRSCIYVPITQDKSTAPPLVGASLGGRAGTVQAALCGERPNKTTGVLDGRSRDIFALSAAPPWGCLRVVVFLGARRSPMNQLDFIDWERPPPNSTLAGPFRKGEKHQ
jgi:hypothetical protein